MPDFVPARDADFDSWSRHLVHAIQMDAALDLEAEDLSALAAAREAFASALQEHVAAVAAARAAKAQKDAARRELTRQVRSVARQLAASPRVRDEQLRAAGLRPRSQARLPVTAPVTVPMAHVEKSDRLRHVLRVSDELGEHPQRRPRGVIGYEVWRKVGAVVPGGPQECEFVGIGTRRHFLVGYEGMQHGGQTAHYLLRWINRHGHHGPWSQTISATIPA